MAGDLSRDLLDPAAWRASPLERFPGAPHPMNTFAYPPETGTEDCWIEGNLISVRGRLRNLLRLHVLGRATVGLAAISSTPHLPPPTTQSHQRIPAPTWDNVSVVDSTRSDQWGCG